MANPNIVSVTSILGNTALANVTSVSTNVLINAVNSNTVVKLNNFIVSNYSSSSVTADVEFVRQGNIFDVVGNVTVPSFSTLVAIGKDTVLYLIEGDYIRVKASANNSAHAIASYEVIS